MKLSKVLKNIDKYFNSDASDEYFNNLIIRRNVLQNRRDALWKFIESLTDNEFTYLTTKFIKWEEEFEESEYQKGIQKTSNLFNLVFDTLRDNANEYYNSDDFFEDGISYRGYQIILYQGQGSFYTIERHGGRIFQSS